ncbi:hypothetical protein, partial [Klebsiella pneumoniae]|uniref:hypothetical protein n=1 Tax=Klebsiella pneumoniae TaxID=573 RepID=UPI00385467C1
MTGAEKSGGEQADSEWRARLASAKRMKQQHAHGAPDASAPGYTVTMKVAKSWPWLGNLSPP